MASVKVPQSKARSRKDGAAIPLDETDKRLMNLLQSSFPLDPEPYALVASEAELELGDVLARTQRLLDGRIIREITPIFDTRALGYESMLVAAKVDSENPQRAAKIVPVGEGDISYRPIFEAARTAGLQYYFIEQDTGASWPGGSLVAAELGLRNLKRQLG